MKIKLVQVYSLLLVLVTMNSCMLLSFDKMVENIARNGLTDDTANYMISEKVFSESELEQLKNSTTIFLLRDQDASRKKEFEEAINAVWNYNKVKVINFEERDQYLEEDYSFFVIEGYKKSVEVYTTGTSGYKKANPILAGDITHVYLTLKLFSSEGENITTKFCRIELFPDFESNNIQLDNPPETVVNLLYKGGGLKNWTPGMIQLYLKDVQNSLRQSRREFLYEDIQEKTIIQQMQNDTLYIPDYVLAKYGRYSGDESQHLATDLFKKYNYPYKLVDSEELSDKILNKELNYVFDYVKSTTENFIRVFSLSDGKIYQGYYPNSYNIKANEIRKILK